MWEIQPSLFSLIILLNCFTGFHTMTVADSSHSSDSKLICLCSRSAQAGRWWWNVIAGNRAWERSGRVVPATRKGPFMTTAGWETTGAAWWVLPGMSNLQMIGQSVLSCPPRDLKHRLSFSVCSHSSSGINRIVQITSNSVSSGGNAGGGGFKAYKGTPRPF